MTTAYSYVRFSSPKQADGDSLRRQTEAFDAYCSANKLTPSRLNFRDLGVSAYKGKNSKAGALSAFLAAVQSGKIAQGSVLVVESLDRLSRQEPLDSQELLARIVRSGVSIVTLTDGQVYSRESLRKNPSQLFLITAVLIRAHEESATKSQRVREAFAAKRKKGEHTNHNGPGWVRWDESKGAFVAIAERVAIVKRMISMALKGCGCGIIARKFNQEGLKTFGAGVVWQPTTVNEILRSRGLLGEYQPMTYANGERKAIGETVKGAYPSILSAGEWYRLQSAINQRRTNLRGRAASAGAANLFGRIMTNEEGKAFCCGQRADGERIFRLAEARAGLSAMVNFSMQEFETYFLAWAKEIDIASPTRVAEAPSAIETEIAKTSETISKLQQKIAALGAEDDNGSADAIIDTLSILSAKRRALQAKREAEIASAAAPSAGAAMQTMRDLIERMNRVEGSERNEIRLQIRAAIQAVVRTMTVVVRCNNKYDKTATAVITFADGLQRIFMVRTIRNPRAKRVTLSYGVEQAYTGRVDMAKVVRFAEEIATVEPQSFSTVFAAGAAAMFVTSAGAAA